MLDFARSAPVAVSKHSCPVVVVVAVDEFEAPGQKSHVELHFSQWAWVVVSFRESPVASIERPPVKSALVTLPPLIPFLRLTDIDRT